MRYRLAIFDLDGTVLDTLCDLADSVNTALARFGYPTHSQEAICAFVGNGVRKLISRALPSGISAEVEAQVFDFFMAHYTAHCADKTAPYAGIGEALCALREKGVRLAMLSNKADSAVQVLCQQYFPEVFDKAQGEKESEGVPKKPAPDAVFSLMRAFDVTAEETVYIGDSEVDVQTAKNAGVDVIAVTWGFRSEACLRGAGALCFAHAPEELPFLI